MPVKHKPYANDGTYQQIAQPIFDHLRKGHVVFIKWVCPKCGERVSGTEPLKIIPHPDHPGQKVVAFPPGYRHDERDNGEPCGQLVDIHTWKFGFSVIMGGDLSWIRNIKF
jgi:hypothetical protein